MPPAYQRMSVDGENIIRIARDGNQTETIAFISQDPDNSERNGRSISIATFPIDQGCVRWWHETSSRRKCVIPSMKISIKCSTGRLMIHTNQQA